jgi:hypothetical protein
MAERKRVFKEAPVDLINRKFLFTEDTLFFSGNLEEFLGTKTDLTDFEEDDLVMVSVEEDIRKILGNREFIVKTIKKIESSDHIIVPE